jgi:TolB-like protein
MRYKFGDWYVEPETNSISRDGTVRHIEPLTMNVLVHLMVRAEQVVTADELLDRFWSNRHAERSMVSRCINHIRKVFGDNARHPSYIETIRKRGYRTIAPVHPLAEGSGSFSGYIDVVNNSVSDEGARVAESPIVAVLPFECLSPKPDDRYIGAGFNDEILTRLSKISAITVTARESVAPYGSSYSSVADVAADLGAEWVVTGRLRFADGQIRVSVRLIDAKTETLKWAESYQHELSDIFSVQTDIALHIAKAMELQFPEHEREKLSRSPTTNVDAYTYYLKGVFFLRNFDFVSAIREMDNAVKAEPKFALALAHKAYVHSIAGTSGFGAQDVLSAEEAHKSMCIAASLVQRVFEIDSGQALAHTAQGKIEMYNRNWEHVGPHSASGYALSPDQVDVAFAHAWSLLDEGQQSNAFRVYERIMVLDPLNSPIPLHASIRARMAGRQDVAIRLCNTYIQEKPNDPMGYLYSALSAVILEDTILAKALVDRVDVITPKSKLQPAHLVLLLEIQTRLGNRKASLNLAQMLSKTSNKLIPERDASFFCNLALMDAELAIRALQNAVQHQLPSDVVRDLHHYSNNPIFDPVRHHPKFQALLGVVGNPAPNQAVPSSQHA